MMILQALRRSCAGAFALTLAACAAAPSQTTAPAASSPPAPRQAMATAANPHAVDAAVEMLREGGSAVDAAIAAELVLGLVEPQSSGIGGGGFLMFYDGASEAISAYDGRERAPAGATPTMFLDAAGRPMNFLDAQASGRSIGVPGLIAMFKLAHDERGRLPWARLFEPAIKLAGEGFAITPRLATMIAEGGTDGRLRGDFAARAYFFDRNGAPWPAGHILRNPEYAATLRAIAAQGPSAMSSGPIADSIIAAARRGPRAGTLTLEDLQAYRPRRLQPVCGAYRVYRVCSMPSPSSANAMIATLGLYERARPHPVGVNNADDWSAFLWASRLAYADRDHYMADDEFVPAPTRELIAPTYLDERARLIDLQHAPERAIVPGAPAGPELFERWGRHVSDDTGTTHLSVVDGYGNAVALTATVESYFGAQRMASGFLLNNELTDFSFVPTIEGRPVANAIEPGKRPRSSMSPAIVTDRNGELVLVIGSPGGSSIISYVARATIAILDWNMPVQEALGVANVTARYDTARGELARLPDDIETSLAGRGWRIGDVGDEGSGLHAIRVTPNGLEGGYDPRREGKVGRWPE